MLRNWWENLEEHVAFPMQSMSAQLTKEGPQSDAEGST